MGTSVAEKLHKIGEVAAISGISVKTIRYYEEIGLLAPTVERSESRYRLFGEGVLNRLTFIKRSQSIVRTVFKQPEYHKTRLRGG
ncbi:MerR family DNA-binding transcriptional regulator [Kamptonema formosum]|uniref:MerR family DNA-binding transcriptional regulator n=1 Tax=Kamptonema formosum TaxID=331992 RepID=UPI0003457712